MVSSTSKRYNSFSLQKFPFDLKLLQRRRQVLSSANILFYESAKEELLIERADRQYLIDEKGNKYLDLSNNVAHVGHCHPVVTNAVTKQMNLQYTNTRYLNPAIVNVSNKIMLSPTYFLTLL